MDLWIRTQSREELKKVDHLYIKQKINNTSTNGYTTKLSFTNIYYVCTGKDELLGEYKSKDRALEILDEIQKWVDGSYTINRMNELKISMDNVFPTLLFTLPKE